MRTFEGEDDVWDAIELIINETKELNAQQGGMDFDIAKSVNAQLAYFCCTNSIRSNNIQKDIERYVYCEQFGISPYPGSYGDQPAKWVDKAFIIKGAFAKKQKEQIDAQRKNNS